MIEFNRGSKLNVWIVTIFEPLPFDSPKTRPQRCGMLAKELLNRGFSVELWTSTFEHFRHVHHRRGSALVRLGPAMSIQFIDGCGYAHDRSPKRLLHNRQTKTEFLRLAAKRTVRPDIIFATLPIPELAEAAVTFAVGNNIPIIVDVRDLWPDVYLSLFPAWAEVLVQKALHWEYRRAERVFGLATGITAVSQTYLDWGLSHARRAARQTDSVFPLGFVSDPSKGQGTANSSATSYYGIDKDNFVLTFVGTLDGYTGVRCVLDAARLLEAERGLQIVIAGDGQYMRELKTQARDLGNVIMTGWLDFMAIWEILSVTKVGLVSYSKSAPMSLPNKPYEYMAAGLPVLSSLRGELEHLIGECRIGRTYVADDPESLATEIRWLLRNPGCVKEMGRRAYRLFTERFRSDIVYGALADHLERIARYGK